VRYIHQVDDERTSRMRYLFDVDWRDPYQYDLVLSLDKLTIDSACDLVIQAVQWEQFQPTEASRRALQNLALSSRISASLDAHPQFSLYDIGVAVKDEAVTLSGSLPSDDAIQQVVSIAEQASGVKQVVNQLIRK
jgi:hypothetical protein